MKEGRAMCTKTELNKILEKFTEEMRSIFGEKLIELILFGSYARGDYHENSDIDIMIIADIEEKDVMRYVYLMSEALSDLSIEYDIMISPIIEPLIKYESYKNTIPFLQKVQKEGIRIAS